MARDSWTKIEKGERGKEKVENLGVGRLGGLVSQDFLQMHRPVKH
jgi:predicted ThiF/HesA family dinucleotide-utilizing enzyme